MEKQNNIPALRFPEFSGEWEIEKLGKIGTFFSGGTPLTTRKDYYGSEIPFIKSGEINAEITEQFLSEAGLKNSSSKMVNKGDVLFALYGATSGEVAISKLGGAINQAVLCVRTKLDNYFLYSFLLRNKASIINTYLQGGQGNLSSEIVKSLFISFPSLPEQTKIATFLTAVDERLSQLKQKETLLKQYQKGVMQKIFDQEIQFKDDDGNGYSEWEVTTFGSLYTFKSTNSLSRDNLNYESGEVKNLHYGDIHTKFRLLLDTANEYIPYINEEIDISKIPSENYCNEGDLVIADASEDYNDIGKAIEVANLNSEKVLAGLPKYMTKIYKYGYHLEIKRLREQLQYKSAHI